MITSKQRAYLRGLANDLDPIFQIGKGGITPNFVKQIFDTLEARELIKVNVLANSEYTAREACEELCQRVGANPVLVAGKKIVLYKRSREHKKIILPGEPPQAKRVKPRSAKAPNAERKTAPYGRSTDGTRQSAGRQGRGGANAGRKAKATVSIAKKGRDANGANRPVRRGF